MAANPAPPSPQKTFYYHADANPLGGTVTYPFNAYVSSQTSVSLPLVGGFIERQSKRQRKWKDLVSYTSESTHVSGSKKDLDGPWTTQVSATIEGLNILEVVTADKIVAQLSVSHPDNGDHPIISLAGSQFVNLRISGQKIEPVIRFDMFEKHDDMPKPYPTKPWTEQEAFLTKIDQQQADAENNYKGKYNKTTIPAWVNHIPSGSKAKQRPNNRNYVICSVIDPIDKVPPNFPGEVCGYGIYVPGFGRVYFGELLVQQGTYRVSMVRAQLGSPFTAAMSAAVASSNGHPGGP